VVVVIVTIRSGLTKTKTWLISQQNIENELCGDASVKHVVPRILII